MASFCGIFFFLFVFAASWLIRIDWCSWLIDFVILFCDADCGLLTKQTASDVECDVQKSMPIQKAPSYVASFARMTPDAQRLSSLISSRQASQARWKEATGSYYYITSSQVALVVSQHSFLYVLFYSEAGTQKHNLLIYLYIFFSNLWIQGNTDFALTTDSQVAMFILNYAFHYPINYPIAWLRTCLGKKYCTLNWHCFYFHVHNECTCLPS